jgi:hypothetical protein
MGVSVSAFSGLPSALVQAPSVCGWAAAIILAVTTTRASAEEPLIGFVYTTDLLPQGKYELEQWATWRAHKAIGEFDVVEGRTEFEYGVSDRLQVAAYLNYEWARAYHDNVITGTTLAPETLANLSVGANEHLNTTRFTGVSLEGIYRILSPYIDPVGVAVYVRPTVGTDFREQESRLILQENFHDDRLVFAFNGGVVEDWRSIPSTAYSTPASDTATRQWTSSASVNLGLAGAYRFAPSWSAGLEMQNERGFRSANFFSSGRTDVAYYLGPSMHYGGHNLFATLTYLNQQPWAKDYVDSGAGFVVGGRTYSANAERFRMRFRFGWYF